MIDAMVAVARMILAISAKLPVSDETGRGSSERVRD